MATLTAHRPARTRQPRPRRPARLPDVFEDWGRPDGSAAQLRYYLDPLMPAGSDSERHVVALYWPWDIDRRSIFWRFTTVEAARVAWEEARLYLASLGFSRLTF